LAALRAWTYIQYFSPNRTITDEDWSSVLLPSIKDCLTATDKADYSEALGRLVTKIRDGHSSLYPYADHLIKPWSLPLQISYVQDQYVVSGFYICEAMEDSPFDQGDVILSIDGCKIQEIEKKLWDTTEGSNDLYRHTKLASHVFLSDQQHGQATVRRNQQTITVEFERIASNSFIPYLSESLQRLREGPAFTHLGDDVISANLQTFSPDDIDSLAEQLKSAKGLLIDLRPYPNSEILAHLGAYLSGDKPFVRLTTPDFNNLGGFIWHDDPYNYQNDDSPAPFDGKVGILINEESISNAEFSTMLYRLHPKAKVFGRQTAGADGNIITLTLPGGYRFWYSSIGVFYPDKTPTQRIGIIPDVEVQPTIEGIREGRDEILEAALAYLREE